MDKPNQAAHGVLAALLKSRAFLQPKRCIQSGLSVGNHPGRVQFERGGPTKLQVDQQDIQNSYARVQKQLLCKHADLLRDI